MTTTAPPTRPAKQRRRWTRLETPQVLLMTFLLVVIDLAAAIAISIVRGDPSCTTLKCRTVGVSTSRPLLALVVAVVVLVVPILVAWWRRRGLRTAIVVQVVVGGLLVAWAASSLSTAVGIRDAPPPVPLQPSLRPCVAVTLAGHTCLSYSETPPPSPVRTTP